MPLKWKNVLGSFFVFSFSFKFKLVLPKNVKDNNRWEFT